MLKLPEGFSGPLYLPVLQRCGATEVRWDGVPAAGQAWHETPHPAPFIAVTAKATAHRH